MVKIPSLSDAKSRKPTIPTSVIDGTCARKASCSDNNTNYARDLTGENESTVIHTPSSASYLCVSAGRVPTGTSAYAFDEVVCPLKSSLIVLVKLVDRALRTRRVHGSLRGRSRWIAACWRQMVGSTEVVLVVAEGTAFSGTA